MGRKSKADPLTRAITSHEAASKAKPTTIAAIARRAEQAVKEASRLRVEGQ
jgi:hypothetical protein